MSQPGNRFVSFVRACMRASGRARQGEAVCVCEAMFLPSLGLCKTSFPDLSVVVVVVRPLVFAVRSMAPNRS